MLRSEFTVISPKSQAEPGAVLGPASEGSLTTIVTGSAALGLWTDAVAADDLTLALWDRPDEPMLLFGGDAEGAGDRLDLGTVVLVATRGAGIDPILTLAGLRDSGPASSWFGVPVVVSPEAPRRAAELIAGSGPDAAAVLSAAGASLTIVVRPGSTLVSALERTGMAPAGCLTIGGDGTAVLPAAIRGLAWSGSFGAIQVREGTSTEPGAVASPSSETAVVYGGEAARRRAAELFAGDDAPFDLVLAPDPGERSGLRVDLAALAGELGDLVVTGPFATAGESIVVGGEAAATARQRLAVSPQSLRGAVAVRSAAGEDSDRYEAHQWASSMRRATTYGGESFTPGGAALRAEARSAGLIGPPTDGEGVDGRTLARIARARGWHVIDPALPPVLEPILEVARRQAAGSDEPIAADLMQRLDELAARPGFWVSLASAVNPPTGRTLVFPYPAPAVEMLRAAAAAGGDPERLRSWLGPVKVAVYRSFSGGSK